VSSSLIGVEEATRQINSLYLQKAEKKLSKRWQWRIVILGLVISDSFCMALAFWTAYLVRFRLNVPVFELRVNPDPNYYRNMLVLFIPIWLVIYAMVGLYHREKLLGGTQEYSSLFNATVAGVVVVIAVGFLWPEVIFARGWLILAWGLAFLFTATGRFMIRRIVYSLRRHGYFLSRAVIIGANNEGLMLAEQLSQWKTSGLFVLGFVDKKFTPGTKLKNDLPVLGKLEQLEEVVNQYGVEELILASSAISSRDRLVDIFKMYAFERNINVHFSTGLYEILTTGVTINQYAYVPLMGISPARLSGVDKVLKTCLDYVLGAAILVLVAPLLLILGILVKLDSKGPVIYKRRVVGLNRRSFDAYKFRTMYTDGETILDQYPELKRELRTNHKLKSDPRITRIGKFLRKFSLDELPQFLNVLKGEMSLVGPRMITPEEIEKYNQWDVNLLTVRPGITGLWQVNGRSDISYDERVRLDMYYIRNWTIWLDLQLILQTIPVVLRSKGAY
jgi:exopolysaccharide biosynthesis polyprenyl glycosylphosphotransferase